MVGGIASVSVALAIAVGVVLAGGNGYKSPKEIGAYFLDSFGRVEPKEFVADLSQDAAETAAVNAFLAGFGLPDDPGFEKGILKASTTGVFSGARGGFGEWNIANRDVWVVVLTDLPISLSCGPDKPSCAGVSRPTFSLAIDATTGEVLSTEMTGGGSRRAKWDPIIERIKATRVADPTRPTATPAPKAAP